MRYSNDKDINNILSAAVKQYRCKVSITGSGHLKITFPSGQIAFGSRTPSDARSAENFRHQLMRAAHRASAPTKGKP